MIVDLFGNNRVPTPPVAGNSLTSNYSAGTKRYGAGRSMPNIGPVSDLLGYAQRDNENQARRNALLRRLRAQDTGNPMNLGYLNYATGVNNGNL